MLIACATSTRCLFEFFMAASYFENCKFTCVGEFHLHITLNLLKSGFELTKKVYRSYTTKISYDNRKKGNNNHNNDNNTATQVTVKTTTIRNRKH